MDPGHPWRKGCDPGHPYWNNQGTNLGNVGRSSTMQQSSSNSICPPGPRPPRPPKPQGGRVSLGRGQKKISNSSGQKIRGRGLGQRHDGKGVLGPGGSSINTPVRPPKKRAKFKSPQIDSQPLGNGSDDSNSSDPPAKSPLDPQEDTPNPPPVSSSTEIGLGSHVTAAVSSDPPLKISDVDVSMTQKNDRGDVLGLGGYIKKKRFLSKISLADVDEEVNKARKKTRLGWGQGLAKYEKRLREKNPHELVADGNGEPRSSSTIKDDEAVVCTSTVPASSDGSSPPPGNNVDLHDNSTDMTEMMVTQGVALASSQGRSPSTGDIGYRGNSSTSLTEIVIHPADEVPDFSRKHSPPPGVGGNSNPCNSSSSMTETVVCTATDLASSHERSLPSGDADDHGNISTSLTETVICPVEEVPTLSRKAVGGSYDPHDSSSSILTETELASSQGLDPPPATGDSGGLGKRSTSLTETVVSRAVPAFSHIHSTPPLPAVGGNNNHLCNSSMNMNEEAMACPASSNGYSLPSDNNGDHGNNSPSLTETVAHPADVRPPSCEYSPPLAVGDNSAHGNRSTISLTTATVVKSENVLASSDECNLPPDGTNTKSAKAQDIPHILISQQSNKIQKQARMPAIILKKLQKPRTKSLKKNILFKEPQTYELQGSTLDKAWSQEEKDIFSEKIKIFNMDFKMISSFLRHKTMADCIEYYSKHYKSECSEKANKYMRTVKQSQEEHNDDAPFMSGIATATATKSYTRMKTVAEDIKKPVDDPICHELMDHSQSHSLPDKGHQGESSMDETEVVTGNVLICEMDDPSPLGKSSPITNSGQAVRLDELKNLNENSSPNEEIITEGQEMWTDKERCRLIQATEKHGKDFTCSMSVYDGTKSVEQCKDHLIKCKTDFDLGKKHVNSSISITFDKSVSNIDSPICISQSNSKVEEHVSQSVMNADNGDGEIYLVGGSSAQGSPDRMSLEKLTESHGHKLANGAIIEDKQISSGEENPELCAESKECNDAAQETNSNINNVDSKAPSDEENPRSNEPPCIATNGAELIDHHQHVQPLEDSSHVEARDDIDLNVALNVDPQEVTSVQLDLIEPHEKADATKAMEHESGIRARATSDLGGDGEAANDMTHVQSTTITETTRQPANQPGRIMLFGKVIYQGPSSSGTNLTSNQERNQIVQSRDMPSNTVVPIMPRGGQVYPSGPSNWRSVPVVDPSQQTVLLNTSIPHHSSNNGFAALPPHQSSALVNVNQQRQHVNIMMPYGTVTRDGIPYHVMPGSGGGLINFNDFNPGHQQMPSSILGTSRMIIGCPPYLPQSIPNQAPIAVPATIQGSTQQQAIRNQDPRAIVRGTIQGSTQQQAIQNQAPRAIVPPTFQGSTQQQDIRNQDPRAIVRGTIQGSALQQAIRNQASRAIVPTTIQGSALQQAIRNQASRAIAPTTIQGLALQQAIRNQASRAIAPTTIQGSSQQQAIRNQAPRAIIVPVTTQDSAQKEEELREFLLRWFAS